MRSLFVFAALLLGCRGKAPPAANEPVVAITVEWPGASSEAIESSVVTHVEAAVAKIAGVRTIESHIEPDRGTVLLVFASTDALEVGTREAHHELTQILRELPPDMPPPAVRRTQRDDRPILWLAVRGSLPVAELSRQAHESIVPAIERLQGVAGAEPHGFAELAIIVRPDLDKLTAAGLPLFDVLAALQSTEVGQIDALGDLIVKQVDGGTIRLHDVAMIEQGFEREPGAAEPTIAVRAQSGASPDEVRRRVRDAIARLELAPGMTIAETPSPLPAPHRPTRTLTLRGPSLDELDRLAATYTAALKGMTIVRDPPVGEPEQTVVPDRDRAAQLGIPMADVYATLRAVGSTQAGQVVVDGTRRPITVKLATSSLVDALDKLYVKSHQGMLLRLSEVVTVKTGLARKILHIDRERAITLAIDGSPTAIEKVLAAHPPPAGYRIDVR